MNRRAPAPLLTLVALLLATLGGGCASPGPAAKVGRIYDRAARYHGPERNPVVVIPGILGSRLVDGESGRTVWGAFAGDWADPRRPADDRTIDYGPGHFTCFQFAYDWRRDLPENAAALDAFLRDRAAYVRRERASRGLAGADAPVKFDLVAQSMGGLLARYYLRYGGADLPDGSDDGPPSVTWAGPSSSTARS